MIRSLVISLALIAAGGVFAEAEAQRSSFSPEEAREAREAGEILSATEIQRLMERRYPRAYDIYIADLIRGPRMIYVIRVLPTPDRRIDVYLDARTGREIPEREVRRYLNRY